MIDIHCHILPGLDDGPQTLEESIEMCSIAADDGITTIVATPHFKPGVFEHDPHIVKESIAVLVEALRARDIYLRILPGADVYVTPELSLHLDRYDYLTIDRKRKYFLAEFPADVVPPRWEEFLLSFRRKGITPIITHPERNLWFLHHRSSLDSFVDNGGLLQITAMSLLGFYGDEVRNFCEFLLKHDLVQAIASDAHASTGRMPVLSQAVRAAESIVGRERAIQLATTIPEAIVQGKTVAPAPFAKEQQPSKRKTLLQRLKSI